MEKTGVVKIGFNPIDFVISLDGNAAFAISKSSRKIARFVQRVGVGDSFLLGNASVRSVQRRLREIGYPIGSIDGINGPQTKAIIQAFGKDRGVKLNPSNGYRKNTEIIAEVEKVARVISLAEYGIIKLRV